MFEFGQALQWKDRSLSNYLMSRAGRIHALGQGGARRKPDASPTQARGSSQSDVSE